MGKTNDLFKKTGDIKRTFHARMGMIKKRSKRQGVKERYTHLNAEFQRIAKRDKKAFLRDQ